MEWHFCRDFFSTIYLCAKIFIPLCCFSPLSTFFFGFFGEGGVGVWVFEHDVHIHWCCVARNASHVENDDLCLASPSQSQKQLHTQAQCRLCVYHTHRLSLARSLAFSLKSTWMYAEFVAVVFYLDTFFFLLSCVLPSHSQFYFLCCCCCCYYFFVFCALQIDFGRPDER